jgi:hypothetical protein
MRLSVDRITPSNATVRVLCKGKACAFRDRSFSPHNRQVRLTGAFRRRRFRPGDEIVVIITAPGMTGRYLSFAPRKGAIPAVDAACSLEGSVSPVGCPGRAGATGLTGSPGVRGPDGPVGPASPAHVRMRTGPAISVNRNSAAIGIADCQSDERATGGGVFAHSGGLFPRVAASFPRPNRPTGDAPATDTTPTGWAVWVANTDIARAGATTLEAPATVTMTPYVICIS